ncbi:hypothetical protein [Streptacidiphilus cavernicola]|uniref:DUF1273 domain-containing protein n=1 Tax=Streptacidiphilus cavernicola TaxID=3342716 RepID=A0ABV6VSG3_9ACTN
MTTLAVTGHMDLTSDSVSLVRAALRSLLTERLAAGPLTGYSCIAVGSDSLFAEELLAAGGDLVVVVPSEDYRRNVVGPDHAALFDRLSTEAAKVITLPFEKAGRRAYEAANQLLLDRADGLVAVWDGQPPTGGGGTGDMVQRATAAGVRVFRIWPEGTSRS